MNFGTEIRLAFLVDLDRGIKENLSIYDVFECGRIEMRKIIREKIHMCSSSGIA